MNIWAFYFQYNHQVAQPIIFLARMCLPRCLCSTVMQRLWTSTSLLETMEWRCDPLTTSNLNAVSSNRTLLFFGRSFEDILATPDGETRSIDTSV